MASPITQAQEDVLTILRNIPVIEGIDSNNGKLFQRCQIWNHQIHHINEGYGNPCAFSHLIAGSPLTLGQGISAFEGAIFRIHICYWELDAADETNYNQNINVFLMRDAVLQALGGQKPFHCATLTNGNEEQDYEHGSMYHYTIDFATNFLDTKGSPEDPDSGAYVVKETPTDIEVDVLQPKIFNNTFNNVFQ